MQPCVKCGTDADVDFLGRCEPCFRNYVNNEADKQSQLSTRKRGWSDGKGSISPAHLDDIRRRRIAPDGSVYRDRGRKSV